MGKWIFFAAFLSLGEEQKDKGCNRFLLIYYLREILRRMQSHSSDANQPERPEILLLVYKIAGYGFFRTEALPFIHAHAQHEGVQL